jgi:hypothetical protein
MLKTMSTTSWSRVASNAPKDINTQVPQRPVSFVLLANTKTKEIPMKWPANFARPEHSTMTKVN